MLALRSCPRPKVEILGFHFQILNFGPIFGHLKMLRLPQKLVWSVFGPILMYSINFSLILQETVIPILTNYLGLGEFGHFGYLEIHRSL